MARPTLIAPTATAAAEPLLEPPGVRLRSHGLRVAARLHPGELGGHRLAEDDRAGLAQRRDARAVALAAKAVEQRRAVPGRHVAGFDDVLDADRHAVDRRKRLARPPAPGRAIGRRPGGGEIERDEGPDLRLPGVEPRDAAFQKFARRILFPDKLRRRRKKRLHARRDCIGRGHRLGSCSRQRRRAVELTYFSRPAVNCPEI